MNYMDYLGAILAVAGTGLQWVRQFRKMSDWWVGLFCLVLASAGYALCNDFTGDIREQIIKAIIWLPGGMATVAGGTFAASKASASVPAIPKTNSR